MEIDCIRFQIFKHSQFVGHGKENINLTLDGF